MIGADMDVLGLWFSVEQSIYEGLEGVGAGKETG